MKKILIVTGFMFLWMTGFSQNKEEFAWKGQQLSITTQNASVEVTGTNDSKVVIESYISEKTPPIPTDADGLRLIASSIHSEQTYFKSEMVKNDANDIVINIPESLGHHYRIKIPKGAHLKLSFNEPSPYGKISFTNLTGELEATGSAPVIDFNYVTGPVTLSAGEGRGTTGASVAVNFSHLQFGSSGYSRDVPFINIISSYADINLSLPKDVKATLQVDSPYGNLYSAFNFVTDAKVAPVKNRYYGLLNGGGRMLTINTYCGNIYIRKETD